MTFFCLESTSLCRDITTFVFLNFEFVLSRFSYFPTRTPCPLSSHGSASEENLGLPPPFPLCRRKFFLFFPTLESEVRVCFLRLLLLGSSGIDCRTDSSPGTCSGVCPGFSVRAPSHWPNLRPIFLFYHTLPLLESLIVSHRHGRR